MAPDIRATASGEIFHQYLSAEKARAVLGWKPTHTFEEGLDRTVAWYRASAGESEHDSAESIPTIILCGGRGTRISEYNSTIPKPMVPIGNRPILWHIMKIYASYGHKDFVLALGWLGDEIRRFFLQYEALTRDFTIHYGARGGIEYLDAEPEEDWRVSCIETGHRLGDRARGSAWRRHTSHPGR